MKEKRVSKIILYPQNNRDFQYAEIFPTDDDKKESAPFLVKAYGGFENVPYVCEPTEIPELVCTGDFNDYPGHLIRFVVIDTV
jgi:hypothetical protein